MLGIPIKEDKQNNTHSSIQHQHFFDPTIDAEFCGLSPVWVEFCGLSAVWVEFCGLSPVWVEFCGLSPVWVEFCGLSSVWVESCLGGVLCGWSSVG